MVSRITRLPLPIDDKVAGWDATIDTDGADSTTGQSTMSASRSLAAIAAGCTMRTSISTHALAHEHLVCGIAPNIQASSTSWLSWKTSLAPHRVCQVASNASGSLIAAALDNGTLSILRGRDGTILATRRVAAEGTRLPASVDFVVSLHDRTDALMILPPEEGPPILVSNMQGERLNSVDNPGVVAEAARNMGLHALRLEGCEDIRAMRGIALYISSTEEAHKEIVRLAIVDGDGRLAIYDHDLRGKQAKLVERSVRLENEEKEQHYSWEIDLEIGLRIQTVPLTETKIASYLLFSMYSANRIKICWMNLQDLVISCQYHITPPNQNAAPTKRARILAMEPVTSCSPSNSLAVVLTMKSPSDKPQLETVVLQAVVDDTLEERAVKQPHQLYTIPVPSSVQSVSFAATSDSPYSFLAKTWSGEDKYDCHLFTVSGGVSKTNVGSVRLLCCSGKFLEAQNALIQCQDESLVKDPFARFHSSEITVKRLYSVLDRGSMSDPQAIATSEECLQHLVTGAISGNSLGQRAFLAVADRILNWPDHTALQNPPSLQEVATILDGMVTATTTVSAAFEGSPEYASKLSILQERREVVQYVQNLLQTNAAIPIKMTKAFAPVQTFQHLFATLVQHSYFAAAESLAQSKLRSKLTAESMGTSILAITPQVHPRLYANLLVETIFPSLSISHEILPSILAWACKTADAFDGNGENDCSLDDAIVLLEMVERATKDLRLRLHSSFSMYSPFVERTGSNRRKIHLSDSTMSGLAAPNISTASTTSGYVSIENSEQSKGEHDVEWQRPNPTILERGRLHGGAQKARLGADTCRVDAVDENEETMEFKLSSARCLKHARSLGLGASSVSLGDFTNCGGAQNIAAKLVKLFSASAGTHETRRDGLWNRVRAFCIATDASYDEALIQYARALCGGKVTSKRAIEEAASVARCGTKAGAKCHITLITLRAALFCRFSPPWLSDLSHQAIEWAAGDSSLRSELEEASRLLLIDGIVGRYCGEGAKELFHVDNPRHAIRLLQFVARHFQQDTVLKDSLDLCDAFAHLSREDVCSRILENAILEGDEATAVKLLMALYERNFLLARSTFSRVVAFCVDLLEERALNGPAAEEHEDVLNVTSCAVALTNIALSKIHSHASVDEDGFSTIHFDESTLEEMLLNLKRAKTLIREHSVSLSLSALRSSKALVKTISKMLGPVVDCYLTKNATGAGTPITQTKRACSLLTEMSQLDCTDLWSAAVGASACRLAMKSQEQECLHFMNDLGAFGGLRNSFAARSCLAVALSFCFKASKMSSNRDSIRPAMKHIITALSLLQDNAVIKCPGHLLDKTLSLAELCDIVTQVLVRADEGIGEELDDFRKAMKEKWCNSAKRAPRSSSIFSAHRPVLQITWYVGDGLLLPPLETLNTALQFCKDVLQAPLRSDSVLGLHSFVDGRAAYNLGLRVLSMTVATRISRQSQTLSFWDLHEAGKRTILSLAERYVGGTSSGITSGIVDSQMAVAFLLCLPLKMAFSVYKSSLPTAIATRDFTRVITLAHVGISAGTGTVFPAAAVRPIQHWFRQRKFVAQCRDLALRAKWWKTLQACGVHFDVNHFQDAIPASSEKPTSSSNYVMSLVFPFISSLSKKHSDPDVIFNYAVQFAEAFGLGPDVPVQQYVVYLLSTPKVDSEDPNVTIAFDDIRLKLGRLNATVKSLIRRLESHVDRAIVLRDCLRRLEEPDKSCDYERLSVVLSLYHAELSALMIKKPNGVYKRNQLLELELVDRRRDALAIVSWYFQGDLHHKRPHFSEFFLPLPATWEEDYGKNMHPSKRRILGPASKEEFDPLEPLEKVLMSSKGAAAAAALAPLCLPLGVPRGYIHARSLLARFKQSREVGAALPSFEDDVLPVLNRLKLSDDVAELAEWCSTQYHFEDEDKLRCLDHALNFAMKASSESEMKCARNAGNDFPEYTVSVALERVKRVNASKDLLADRLAINTILNSVGLSRDHCNALGDTVKDLMRNLDETVWQREKFVPEHFVETFIAEASLIASEACLSPRKAMSVGQLRQFSNLIYQASTALADKYSHVQVNDIGCRLVRSWLFHGDHRTPQKPRDTTFDVEGRISTSNAYENTLTEIDEDDTMNFVMDLNALQRGSNALASVTGPDESHKDDSRLTSEEEPRGLSADNNARELSDQSNQRASLRIAFVMAFMGVEAASPNGNEVPGNEENEEPTPNTMIKPRRLRSKLSAHGSKQKVDTALNHSRELLRIVFAKSISSGWIVHDSEGSFNNSFLAGSSSDSSKEAITFAMRYRALRVASILCPQESLQEVIDDEELIQRSNTSLRKSAFAAFIAKEIEEMALPLPHSDLAQLSTIHFPSYARTLWRHHREHKRSKGRLLLLILEMYLKEEISNYEFFFSVVREIEKLNLPRTLLLAFECIVNYMFKMGPDIAALFIERESFRVFSIVRLLSERIIRELSSTDAQRMLSKQDECEAVITTLHRFSTVLQNLTKYVEGQLVIVDFIDGLLDVTETTKQNQNFRRDIARITQGLLRHVGTGDDRNRQYEKLNRLLHDIQT